MIPQTIMTQVRETPMKSLENPPVQVMLKATHQAMAGAKYQVIMNPWGQLTVITIGITPMKVF
jgi:hypothetical protein